ncbi:MAG TPA: hypothetical protein EYG80_07005 [Flavobacteriaceae bacterium]|nr:hypothetical protein [Flavobacteriaceae bacterium]
MKKLVTTLFIVFTALIGYTQNDSIPKHVNNYYSDLFGEFFKESSFKIGTGVLIPQKRLKKYFDISPFVELGFDFQLRKRKSIEFVLQLVAPNQKKQFQYSRTNDTIAAKATFMVNPILKFKKYIVKTNKSQLSIGLGIGGSFITTDARNPHYKGETGSGNKKEKYESINTILIVPCMEYTFAFSNDDYVTLGFNIQYAPYKVEGSLQTNIGNMFYVPRIAYKF